MSPTIHFIVNMVAFAGMMLYGQATHKGIDNSSVCAIVFFLWVVSVSIWMVRVVA